MQTRTDVGGRDAHAAIHGATISLFVFAVPRCLILPDVLRTSRYPEDRAVRGQLINHVSPHERRNGPARGSLTPTLGGTTRRSLDRLERGLGEFRRGREIAKGYSRRQ